MVMLLLTFKAAANLYAVDVTHVIEVVPRVDLRRLPHAPDFIAGLFDYRGTVVPVIDLGIRLGSEGCRDRLSTRIILVDSRPADHNLQEAAGDPDSHAQAQGPRSVRTRAQDQRPWLLGLIAEQVSDVKSVTPEQVMSESMQLPQTPYLGAIVDIDHQMIQLMVTDKILDGSLQKAFFKTGPDGDRALALERNVQARAR
jgi:chemotaxis-related protein WspB